MNLALNNIGADSVSSISSRSGLNSARGGTKPFGALLTNPNGDMNSARLDLKGNQNADAAQEEKVDYFKKIKTLNNTNMSIRENKETNSALRNVKEMLDPARDVSTELIF